MSIRLVSGLDFEFKDIFRKKAVDCEICVYLFQSIPSGKIRKKNLKKFSILSKRPHDSGKAQWSSRPLKMKIKTTFLVLVRFHVKSDIESEKNTQKLLQAP